MIISDEISLIINSIVGLEDISEQQAAKLLHFVREIEPKYAEICNDIIPNSALFLTKNSTELLVRAEISIEEAMSEIDKQKKYIIRFRDLAPDILRYFKFNDTNQIISAINIIDDCHHDYWVLLKSNRRDRARREALDCIKIARAKIRDAIQGLSALDRILGHDYLRLVSSYNRAAHKQEKMDFDLLDLIREMELCSAVIEICELQALEDDDYLIISDGRVKTSVVEYAYLMTNFYDGPPLVTTPNSDFAYVCGILYEIASGNSDESLSGAINRFAKSDKRKNFDKEERDFKEENSMCENIDNFTLVEKTIYSAQSDYEKFKYISNKESLTAYARVVASTISKNAADIIDRAKIEYGPNLIWAHQLPESEWRDQAEAMEKAKSVRVDLAIKLGKLRRLQRSMN